jgi:methylmalonyl-CoA/ethylmalonyl-CoA epimerase
MDNKCYMGRKSKRIRGLIMVVYTRNEAFLSKFTKVDQIGIIVKDLEKKMKFYEQIFGIEPFLTLESEINSAKLKIGLLYLNEIQIELIEVLEGETIHSKFLESRGEGLHHIGFFVDDIETELTRLKRSGIKVLERGTVLEITKFAYLDTEKELGVILELIQFD